MSKEKVSVKRQQEKLLNSAYTWLNQVACGLNPGGEGIFFPSTHFNRTSYHQL